MNKELEALNKWLKEYLTLCEKLNTNQQEKMLLNNNSPYNILKTYFESIDNTNPSEALENLEQLVEMADKCWVSCDVHKWKNTIKQDLLKAQEQEKKLKEIKKKLKEIKADLTIELHNKKNAIEMYKQQYILREKQEKVLEIIKKKRVNVEWFWNDFVDNGFGYHYYLEKWYKYQSTDKQKLTEEEFDLLKRWLGKDKSE